MKTPFRPIFRLPLSSLRSLFPRFSFQLSASSFFFVFALILLVAPAAFAVDAAWTGTTNSTWSEITNWSTSPVPGAGNTATFNGAGNGNTAITVGTISLTNITFDTASAAAYTLGTGADTITLATGTTTAVTMNSTVAQNETINANLILGTAAASATTFSNNSTTNLLTLGGNITGGTGGAAAAKTITVTGAGNTTISGIIANGGGTSVAVTKTGTGTVTLSNANTYSGTTTVSGGPLVLSGTNNSAGATSVSTGGILQLANTTANNGGLASGLLSLGGGGILQATSAAPLAISNAVAIVSGSGGGVISGNQSLTFNGSLTNNGGNRNLTNSITGGGTLVLAGPVYLSENSTIGRGLNLIGAGNTTINGAIANFNGSGIAGSLTTAGGGTITLNGNNTYTGVTTIGVSTVILNGTSASSSIVLNSNGAVFTESDTGVIASGSLSVGTGTTGTLAGNNTYAGGTTLTSGTLNINSATALGNGTFTIASGTINNTSAAAVTLTNNNVQAWNGNFAFTGTKDLNLGTGAVTMSANRTVTVNGSNLTVGGIISGPTFGLTKAGNGTLVLAGANTYNGTTTVNAGILVFGNTSAKASGNVTAAAAGSIGLGVGAVSGAYNAVNVADLFNTNSLAGFSLNAASGVAIDTSAGNFTQSTALTAARGLTKLGINTLTLSVANTYTGATTVSAGTLLVNGSTSSSSAVNVSSGAILGGNGTIGGIVNVKSGGTIAPGNSPGLLTVGSLVLDAGSATAFEVAGTTTRGGDYDAITVTTSGGLTLNGAFTINFTNIAALGNTTNINLFGYSGLHTGDFSSLVSTGFYAGTWTQGTDTYTLASGGQTLTFSELTGSLTVVPEPATWALLTFSLTTVMVLRRRRRD